MLHGHQFNEIQKLVIFLCHPAESLLRLNLCLSVKAVQGHYLPLLPAHRSLITKEKATEVYTNLGRNMLAKLRTLESDVLV